MKCETIKQIIDHYFDSGEEQLPAGVRKHIDACVECHQYYKAGKKLGDVSKQIRRSTPGLNDPQEMMINIIEALDDRSSGPENPSKGKLILLIQHKFFRQIVSVAAIALFAIFTCEHFIVLNRINRLENQYVGSAGSPNQEIKAMKNYRLLKILNSERFINVSIDADKNDFAKESLYQFLGENNKTNLLIREYQHYVKSIPAQAFRPDAGI